jgi:hypothetical protein
MSLVDASAEELLLSSAIPLEHLKCLLIFSTITHRRS